jgi:hypothetical protein
MANEMDFIVRGLSDAKAATGVFTLPCGLLDKDGVLHDEVQIREMTGYEEDLLAAKGTPMAVKMNNLIAACTTRIGAITDRGQINAAIKDLPVGDRVFLLFAVRKVSLGDSFPFRQKCPSCGTESIYHVLLSELDVKNMPNKMQRIYDIVLPSGTKARFKLLTGKEEDAVTAASSAESAISIAMLARTVLLNDAPPTLEAMKSLSFRDRQALRAQFEAVDGGIDTSVENTCDDCGYTFKTDLDLGHVGFFFPSVVKKL